MMQGEEDSSLILSLSPSFSSYSSGNFAEIAARVVEEFRHDSDSDYKADNSLHNTEESGRESHPNDDGTENVGEIETDEFEFAVVPREPLATTISADEIFYNGQIRPIYPIFNTNLLLNDSRTVHGNKIGGDLTNSAPARARRPSLGKLMNEDREMNSCSSSEADELDGIPSGTYCVWSPKESLERCKKSNSMGSSKRWKLRDLLYRSNSDTKDVFLFLNPNKKMEKVAGISTGDEKSAGKVKGSRVAAAMAAHVKINEQSVMNGSDEKKTLSNTYGQDLVGSFKNVSDGMSRNLHPLRY